MENGKSYIKITEERTEVRLSCHFIEPCAIFSFDSNNELFLQQLLIIIFWIAS